MSLRRLPLVLGLAGIGFFLARLGLTAQRQPATTGIAGMIDQIGEVLTAIEPGHVGRVSTRGEIWHAKANEAIAEGSRVRVTGLEGLTLTVRKD